MLVSLTSLEVRDKSDLSSKFMDFLDSKWFQTSSLDHLLGNEEHNIFNSAPMNWMQKMVPTESSATGEAELHDVNKPQCES